MNQRATVLTTKQKTRIVQALMAARHDWVSDREDFRSPEAVYRDCLDSLTLAPAGEPVYTLEEVRGLARDLKDGYTYWDDVEQLIVSLHQQPAYVHPTDVRVGDVWQYFWDDGTSCSPRMIVEVDGGVVSGQNPEGEIHKFDFEEFIGPASGWRLKQRAGKPWPPAEEPLPQSDFARAMNAEYQAHRKAHPDAYCSECHGAMECPYCDDKEEQSASPLPEVGSWWWHPEKGLVKVDAVGQIDFRMVRPDGTLLYIQGMDSTWNEWVPVFPCCEKGCAYYRTAVDRILGSWYDSEGRELGPATDRLGFRYFTPCRRVLGVTKNGQPTVTGPMVEAARIVDELDPHEDRKLIGRIDALAAEPLGEGE